jgi:predicted HNH restriction endonuclease
MFTHETPPTKEAYETAITALASKLTELQRTILAIHFSLPAHAMTSQRLRDELGYSGIAASNGAYGKLGHLIADAVGFDPGASGSVRRDWWRCLSTGDHSGDSFVWLMRPELAAALVSLELVDPHTDGAVDLVDLDIPEEPAAIEGRLSLRSHLARERSRSLVEAKKNSSPDRRCEICGFSSLSVYGVDYCEVHHLVPIAKLDGSTPTRLEDLAVVCANCHRIIHYGAAPLTLDQVRAKLRRPNQAPEPTTTAGTSAAKLPRVPAVVVAHL